MAKVFLRAYNREIETMIDRGQLDEAIAHCHHILKTFPKYLETYRLLGKAYLEGKRYGDAVDVFSRVLAAVPNDFVSHVGLSIIRDEENKLDDAIWHMERAFENQPSNSAIQGELQRLYGRRDGVQPPRIRMTRGALAHMYVQGELYPQAVSEIKSVLQEDPGRNDMQSLLARAHFKSGAKNDAVDAALALLQRYPYAFDANRVLVDVLSADRSENAQAYRQRVAELDPYAAQVTGSVFRSDEVADAAVNLERLDWNGQPVAMQSDWRDSQAIALEGNQSGNEQPDWLKSPFGETTPATPAQPPTSFGFDTPASTQAAPAQPANEFPDFLKDAGWGESTGAFDESKSMFADEGRAASAEPLAQGDLPDWVKAMKPSEPEPEPDAPQQEEALPDWINQIGTGALAASGAQPDWMNQPEDTQQPAADNDQLDWLKGFDAPQESAQPVQDQPDWLNAIGSETDIAPQPAQTDTPDWLKGFGSESELTSQPAHADSPEWLKASDSEPVTPTAESDDDWLKQFGSQPAEATAAPEDFDFITEVTQEPVLQTPEEITPPVSNFDELGKSEQERDDSFAWLENLAAKQGASEGLLTKPEERLSDEPEWVRQAKGLTSEPPVVQPPANIEELGKSEQERDDSFAWLENLAAKQGASEGLLTRPEERLTEEPEWVKQAKSLTSEPPVVQPPMNVGEPGTSEQEGGDSFAWLEDLATEEGSNAGPLSRPEELLEDKLEWVEEAKESAPIPPSVPVEPPVSEPMGNVEELGKSEQERDDSFAWLENLAAKQGASEGLLTKPEDRLQEEPEWVKQAKAIPAEPSVSQPTANAEDLGKSEQERDDSFAWLENLAAKQGASEGLLTKPEERMEQEPEWVRQAKDLSMQQPVIPAAQADPVMEQPAPVDDTVAWLKSLEEQEKPSQPVSAAQEELVMEQPAPVDDTVAWLKSLEEEEKPSEPVSAVQEAPVMEQPAPVDDTVAWLKSLEEEEKPSEPVSAADQTAIWFKNLDKAESASVVPAAEPVDADMPAWMKSIDQDEAPAAEPAVPELEAEPSSTESEIEESSIPSWLSDLDKEESVTAPTNADDLPAWLRDGTGEAVAEPVRIEPTRPTDWKPSETEQPEVQYSPLIEEPKQPEIIYSPPLEETKTPEPEELVPSVSFEEPHETPAPPPQEKPEQEPEPRLAKKIPSKPAPRPEVRPEPRKGTGMLVMPGIDSMLGSARSELSRSNIPGALESYARLIKKGRFLDEVIYDLREALYRYPVEVSIWQSLGDAYMRANRLQDALDAYTKAEELLR